MVTVRFKDSLYTALEETGFVVVCIERDLASVQGISVVVSTVNGSATSEHSIVCETVQTD